MHQIDGFDDRPAIGEPRPVPPRVWRPIPPEPAPGERAAHVSASLGWLIGVLGLLLLLIHVVPLAVERLRYAWVRGQQQAEYDVAGKALQQIRFDDLSRAFRLVSQRVRPSVVQVHCEQPFSAQSRTWPPVGFPRRLSDQGSGVIVAEDGYVLTNAHVIEGATAIHIRLADGRRMKARVVGIDRETDLAVLKIDAGQLIAAAWADSDKMDVGMPVWAVGSPFGLDSSITFGIISAKHRAGKAGSHYQDFLQTDAAVNPGNSGGPLVDAYGRIVGINTAILGEAYQGVSFAVPSNVARRVYERIRKVGYVRRGWLGVMPADLTEETARQLKIDQTEGALVLRVVGDNDINPSPARQAGIKVRDVIVQWGETPIRSASDLYTAVAATEAGAVVDVRLLRGGRTIILPVRVGERPRRDP